MRLLSPPDILVGSNDFLFGVTAGNSGVPGWAYPASAIIWTVVALAALVWRYRRIEP
jgi:hypothetical protein